MAHLIRASFNQNPNVGLYGYASNTYALLGNFVPKKLVSEIEQTLKVPVHVLSLCGTPLIGAFATGNSNCLLVPSIAFESELKLLEKLKIKYHVLNTRHTALGNNIACNDTGCLINPDMKEHASEIEAALGVKVKVLNVKEIPTVGSLIAMSEKGAMASALMTSSDQKTVSSHLKLPVTRGTVNLGSPFIRSGVIVNKFGFVLGNKTGGPEAVAIDQALGFL